MRYVDVKAGTAEPVEGQAYPVDVYALEKAGVVIVAYPDSGPAWVERVPFKGREGSAALIALGDAAMAEAMAQHTAPPPEPTLADVKAERIADMEDARKAAGAEGVTVNGIRYAGDPSNRQALREAIEYADAEPLDVFPSWKTSDDEFVTDHPVQDVRDAYAEIGARRSQLIAREGQRVAEIAAADDVATVEAITW